MMSEIYAHIKLNSAPTKANVKKYTPRHSNLNDRTNSVSPLFLTECIEWQRVRYNERMKVFFMSFFSF